MKTKHFCQIQNKSCIYFQSQQKVSEPRSPYSHTHRNHQPTEKQMCWKTEKDINYIPLPAYCSSLCFLNTHTPKHTLSSLPNYRIYLTGNHENSQPRATFDYLGGGKKQNRNEDIWRENITQLENERQKHLEHIHANPENKMLTHYIKNKNHTA